MRLVGSISSRFGSAVVCPPPNYGWITGPQRLSVTSHPVFMQITKREVKMAKFVAPQKKNKPVSKDVFYVGMFWFVQGKT